MLLICPICRNRQEVLDADTMTVYYCPTCVHPTEPMTRSAFVENGPSEPSSDLPASPTQNGSEPSSDPGTPATSLATEPATNEGGGTPANPAPAPPDEEEGAKVDWGVVTKRRGRRKGGTTAGGQADRPRSNFLLPMSMLFALMSCGVCCPLGAGAFFSWVLTTLGNLQRPAGPEGSTTLDLSGTEVTDAGLKQTAQQKHLTTLRLSRTNVTDAGLKELAPLQNLTTLHLDGTQVTDEGLKELAPLQNLTTLYLDDTKVTDRTLAVLREIKLLHTLTRVTISGGTTLDLSRTAVTDEGLKELATLQNLTTLDLGVKPLTDRTLAVLREINLLHTLIIASTTNGKRPTNPEGVTTLYLDRTKVTDEGLKDLAPLRKLTTLYLDRTKVTDRTLAVLREINLLHAMTNAYAASGSRPSKPEDVTRLNLSGTQVTDKGLKELGALKNLAGLDLSGTKVTDEGLKELAPLQNLTRINLSGTKVTDAGLKALAALKNLTTLDLDGTRVTDAGVKELQKALPKCQIIK